MIATVTDHIYAWMENRPPQAITPLMGTDETLILHAACKVQNDIGWENCFRCRLTLLWAQCRPTNATPDDCQWTNRLTQWIWDTVLSAWHNRNKLVFGTTTSTANDVHRLRLEARITDLYAKCSTLPTHLRSKHIYKPYEDLIKSHPNYLTLWITQAEQTLRAHRKFATKGYHTPITRFFPTLPRRGG